MPLVFFGAEVQFRFSFVGHSTPCICWRSELADRWNLALDREVGEFAFGLDPEGYHAARLPYPAELYDELFGRTPQRAVVLEIGVGTGLVTQELLSRDVSSVTAIEPNHALAAFT